MKIPKSWEEVVATKRRLRDEALGLHVTPDNESLMLGKWSQVSETGQHDRTAQYLSELRDGKITCERAIEAFINRAREIHKSTNCLTEIAFDDARKQARDLDQHFSKHGTLVGPLHGIPVTLKDQFNLKGLDTTLGYVARAFSPVGEDAVLVNMLKRLGAIVIAKSNLPQSIMWCETENPLWGLTTHPLDKAYTPGGSTGGEGVLLATGASFLGWGTDIGGSIRIPSHMMGLYGLKPSSSRLPYRGVPVTTDGQEHVPSSVGPMARDLATLELSMRSIIGLEPWKSDARCAPIPWREAIYQQTLEEPLTIGVLYDDEVVRPHPPLIRVLKQTVEALQHAGHDIVEWNADLHAECIEVMDQFYTVDGGQDVRDEIAAGGEPMIPHVLKLTSQGPPISVFEYWKLNRRKFDLHQRYLDKWNNIRSPKTGRQVDILLMPPMPHTAVPHRSCRWVGYTKVWNFLDYSALVIPGGKVSQTDLDQAWDFDERGPLDAWNATVWRENKGRMAELNLSVGIQLVCRKLEEEKLLAAAKVVDALVHEGLH